MKTLSRKIRLYFLIMAGLATSIVGFASPKCALAADYPNRPIKILTIVAPGGGLDFTARILADYIGKKLNQQVIVQNEGGGGGNIALEMAANAPPDGYTLIMTSPAMITNHFLFSKAPFDPIKSFEPISLVTRVYFLMVANSSLPVRSLPEFIAYAKVHPGEVSTANGAIGGTSYLAEVLLNQMANIKLKIINYPGNSPAIVDLLGDHIDTMFSDPPPIKSDVSAGRLRILGITSPQRTKGYPNVPAIAETLPGYEIDSWYGLLAPAGTPKDVVQLLSKLVAEALNDPTIRQAFIQQDATVVGSTPEEFAATIRSDMAKDQKLIATLGIHLD